MGIHVANPRIESQQCPSLFTSRHQSVRAPAVFLGFKNALDRNWNAKYSRNQETGWAAEPAVHYLSGDSTFMRIFSCVILLVSVLMFAKAGYDEYRGVTRISAGRNSISEVITRTSKPEQFHNAMTYHWFYASMILMAGIFAYMVENGLEKSDPLSPDYAGNKALDDWSDAMKEEEEQRKHPKQ
jgi:hypothetical protein